MISQEEEDYIKFLGTGGARVVVSRQARSSAGALLSLSGVKLYLDPGPGALVHCWQSKPPVDPALLDGIIVTHRHLDHAGDLNAMTEAMTKAGYQHRGSVFLPGDALSDDPVLFHYLRPSVEHLEILEAGKSYQVNHLTFTTPVRHLHSVETYGLLLTPSWGKIAWIADTLYFPALAGYYQSDLLILNVLLLERRYTGKIQHLYLDDARLLIREIRPKMAVLTHFGLTMLQADPRLLADRLSDETGVEVLAARDGMVLSLSGLK